MLFLLVFQYIDYWHCLLLYRFYTLQKDTVVVKLFTKKDKKTRKNEKNRPKIPSRGDPVFSYFLLFVYLAIIFPFCCMCSSIYEPRMRQFYPVLEK